MTKCRAILVCATITIIAGAALFASRPVLEFIRDPLFEETDTKHYRTQEEVTDLIRLGWLPQLPASAHDIREKRNTDYGTIVVQFSFSPQQFPSGFPAMTALDGTQARQVGPRWLVRRAEWVPAGLRTGRIETLLAQGFVLCRLDQQVGQKSWYLLIHSEKGVAYGWNSNAG